MLAQFLAVYLVVQLITLATLPLAWRLFAGLPDRGYAFARILGILLVGVVFWLGYSYGIVRYEPGAGWLGVIAVAVAGTVAGWPVLRAWRRRGARPFQWRQVLVVELIFLVAFAAWAWVRAYDPAANHTEKPMDLMFMNSIRSGLSYPPPDAWLAGYSISYYYFGYWLLTTIGMLAGQPPEVAYNVCQACWYGLLLTGSFGIVYNLLAAARRRWGVAVSGGLLALVMVGMSANLQGIMEWLHANGVAVDAVAAMLQVPGFPQDAAVTRNWYVDYNWWWWRSSRVIEDLDLAGRHIEVIDEFPAFSYILGDNHPHVVAMPFGILAIALALNMYLHKTHHPVPDNPELHASDRRGGTREEGRIPWWHALRDAMPFGWGGWLLAIVVSGSLLFLNTWDYPPAWLLISLVLFIIALRQARAHGEARGVRHAFVVAVAGAGLLAAGALVVYLPYFLTAQSQAGGLVPNLFNPTRLSQFVAMFAMALLTTGALLLLALPRPGERALWRQVLAGVGLVLGLPLLFLLGSVGVVTATPIGQELLARMPLPPGASGHLPFIAGRWLSQPFTLILTGCLLGLALALLWARLTPGSPDSPAGSPDLTFVLLLASIGLLLVYVPEFAFLRDNFGTRMNTIFKFYYQAWLYFGLAGAYTIVVALSQWRGRRAIPAVLSGAALLLALVSTLYLLAGAYSKAQGFASATPSFDATAYLADAGPDELAAVRWVRENTLAGDIMLEGKGASYRAEFNRMSTMTGRPTLLGWDGHESQWRGRAYGQMAAGRPAVLERIYRDGSAAEVAQLLRDWGIDYVYVGPAERAIYGLGPDHERRLAQAMDLVFERPNVRIYRAR